MPKRRTAQAVKLSSHYWSPESPLDGIGRAVWAALLLLARESLCRRDMSRDRSRDSHEPARRDSHAPADRDSHALEQRDSHADAWPAVSLRGLHGEPLTLAELVRFTRFERHQVARSLDVLERLGEVEKSADNAYVVRRYHLTQETPEARRKQRQRERKRRDTSRDMSRPDDRDSHGTSHADERDSHASRARAPEDLKKREEIKISTTAAASLSDPAAHAPARDSAPPPPSDETLDELVPSSPEYLAQAWLHAVMFSITLRPAPPASGKWRAAYRFIGQQSRADRERVASVLAERLRTGGMHPRMCTPRHLQDYWPDYLHGTPPGSPLETPHKQRTGERAAAADELGRDAQNNPAWLLPTRRKDLPS